VVAAMIVLSVGGSDEDVGSWTCGMDE